MRSVKAFYKWLLREKTVLQNPVELVPPPKFNRYPLRQSLTLKEITHLLNEPDAKTDGGILQKAILECFYSSGIRLRELCRLKVDDVDTVKGVIRINKGKGGRDRLAIIGNSACLWIRAYRELVRPKLAKPDEENLFLGSKEGHPINPLIVGRFVKELARKAGIKGNVTPHSLRHACASQLLRNGASLVEVKDILGHELIESTKQYTRISINDLKAIHKQFHPRQ